MDINEIKKLYESGHYQSKILIPSKVKEGYVFDEELSVRRNKELVVEHNKMVDDLRTKRNQDQNKLNNLLRSQVMTYMTDTYEITDSQASLVNAYVMSHYHSNMYDYFHYIDEVAELAELLVRDARLEILNCKK